MSDTGTSASFSHNPSFTSSLSLLFKNLYNLPGTCLSPIMLLCCVLTISSLFFFFFQARPSVHHQTASFCTSIRLHLSHSPSITLFFLLFTALCCLLSQPVAHMLSAAVPT